MNRVLNDSFAMEFKSPFRNLKFAILIAALLFTLCYPAEAQQQAKVARLGEIRASTNLSPRSKLFHEALQGLGYIEGKNIAFEYRLSEGKLDRLPALAEELARLKVDVLIASSTAEAVALKNATRTIPIVLVGISDPIGSRLIDSLARPGANITGITNISVALTGKRLELLKETFPKLSRVALLWDPKEPSSKQQWNESQTSARELGLQLLRWS